MSSWALTPAELETLGGNVVHSEKVAKAQANKFVEWLADRARLTAHWASFRMFIDEWQELCRETGVVPPKGEYYNPSIYMRPDVKIKGK